MAESQAIDPAQREVALNYVDKLSSALQQADHSAARFLWLQSVLSTILIALATGLVSAGDELEISGIGIELRLPLWAVMAAGSVVTAIFTTMTASQYHQGLRLQQEVVRIYAQIGYDLPRENTKRYLTLTGSPLDALFGTESESTFGTVLDATAVIALYLVPMVLLPLVAQGGVIIKLGSDFGWSWLVLIPLPAVLLVSAASAIRALLVAESVSP